MPSSSMVQLCTNIYVEWVVQTDSDLPLQYVIRGHTAAPHPPVSPFTFAIIALLVLHTSEECKDNYL